MIATSTPNKAIKRMGSAHRLSSGRWAARTRTPRTHPDKDKPGMRYNIYAIDYGTYVDLLGTLKSPQLNLLQADESTELVVPFDDKRAIRRILLSERIFSDS